MTRKLVLIPSVHVVETASGLRMDDKFQEGLGLHARNWNGSLRVLIRKGTADLPFSSLVDVDSLPCELILLEPNEPVTEQHLSGAAVVLAAADDTRQLHLPRMAHAVGAKIVYAIEYDLRTRLRIARLDHQGRPIKRLRTTQWLIMQEIRRRRALKAADAIQANGYPAAHAYGRVARDTLVYLDGRMNRAAMAIPSLMAARDDYSGPLRIIAAGRLIPMKGAQDLVPFAAALHAKDFAFTLDIYGDGTLRNNIEAQIKEAHLGDRVRLHGAVDFLSRLVPDMQKKADLFLAPHRQSDPSCAYIEAMGCGLPVLGSDNRMWRPMARQSGGGWVMPQGDPRSGAVILAGLTRSDLREAGIRALEFAREHDFNGQFRRRMDHLRRIAG